MINEQTIGSWLSPQPVRHIKQGNQQAVLWREEKNKETDGERQKHIQSVKEKMTGPNWERKSITLSQRNDQKKCIYKSTLCSGHAFSVTKLNIIS